MTKSCHSHVWLRLLVLWWRSEATNFNFLPVPGSNQQQTREGCVIDKSHQIVRLELHDHCSCKLKLITVQDARDSTIHQLPSSKVVSFEHDSSLLWWTWICFELFMYLSRKYSCISVGFNAYHAGFCICCAYCVVSVSYSKINVWNVILLFLLLVFTF